MADAVAQRSNNDNDEGPGGIECSHQRVVHDCLARSPKTRLGLREKRGQTTAGYEIVAESAGLLRQFAAPRNPMGMTRRRPEMGILLGESVDHHAADLD